VFFGRLESNFVEIVTTFLILSWPIDSLLVLIRIDSHKLEPIEIEIDSSSSSEHGVRGQTGEEKPVESMA
jgi:hypothetical protein